MALPTIDSAELTTKLCDHIAKHAELTGYPGEVTADDHKRILAKAIQMLDNKQRQRLQDYAYTQVLPASLKPTEMALYEVCLSGYDQHNPKTNHLIKWVMAPPNKMHIVVEHLYKNKVRFADIRQMDYRTSSTRPESEIGVDAIFTENSTQMQFNETLADWAKLCR